MVFLSDSERRHLTDMIQAEVAVMRERMMQDEDGDDNTVEVAMDPRCADSDHHLFLRGCMFWRKETQTGYMQCYIQTGIRVTRMQTVVAPC